MSYLIFDPIPDFPVLVVSSVDIVCNFVDVMLMVCEPQLFFICSSVSMTSYELIRAELVSTLGIHVSLCYAPPYLIISILDLNLSPPPSGKPHTSKQSRKAKGDRVTRVSAASISSSKLAVVAI
jgi:hypothetical protein